MTSPRMTGRLVVRITPDDVGRRVSVRSRIGHDADGPRFTDVLGVLERWDGGTLSIRRRDGELVEVAEAQLVAGRVVPPPPRRRPG